MGTAISLPAGVRRFITQDMHSVKGWISPADASLVALVDGWQRAHDVHGDLCEIGVYHGRSLALLALLVRPDETAFGVDLFDSPDAHKWGRGDRDRALQALARFCNGARCELITKSSLQLIADDLRGAGSASPRIRLFCIDGGHEREIAEHDFRFAERVLAPGGVVVVDDFFNRRWPGVSEAINAVFASGETALRPFAIGQAKVFFAKDEFADRYRAALERDWRPALDNPKVLFGMPVAMIPLPTKLQRVRSAVIARLAGLRRMVAHHTRLALSARQLWVAGTALQIEAMSLLAIL